MASDRTLPHNLEAEKCVLGAILINNQVFNQAAEVIDSDDFFREAHRRIWEKMVELTDRSEPVDLITLKDELTRSAQLDDVGGPAYIAALTDGVPRSANVEYYAKIVKEKSTLRKLIQSANEVLVRAYDAEEDADNLLDDVKPGAIVLLHDGDGDVDDPRTQGSRAPTVAATGIVIEALKGQGYRFATVGELMAVSAARRAIGEGAH